MELSERELLVEIHADVKNLKETVTEIKVNCRGQNQNCSDKIKEKVSKFTFIVVVTIVSGIIGYIAIDVKDLKAEIMTISKTLSSK